MRNLRLPVQKYQRSQNTPSYIKQNIFRQRANTLKQTLQTSSTHIIHYKRYRSFRPVPVSPVQLNNIFTWVYTVLPSHRPIFKRKTHFSVGKRYLFHSVQSKRWDMQHLLHWARILGTLQKPYCNHLIKFYFILSQTLKTYEVRGYSRNMSKR